jgi:hypothetical protein
MYCSEALEWRMGQPIYTRVSIQEYLRRPFIHEQAAYVEGDTWGKLKTNSSGLLRLTEVQVRQLDTFKEVVFKMQILHVVRN